MDEDTCAKCEEKPGNVCCSCGERFCQYCFANKHLPRNRTHIEIVSQRTPNTVESLVGAAKTNDTVQLVELLEQNVPIDGKHHGWTALGYAAYNGHLDTVHVLLLRGADMDIRMDVGFGVLPGDGSAINWAAYGGYLDIIKLLLETGAKADICATRPVFLGTGGTPITMAAGKGHLEVVRYLLEKGCDDDSEEGVPGWEAFIIACERGQLNIIRYLLEERGMNVNRIGNKGLTPLITAVQSQQTSAMDYLIKCGAQIDANDNEGSTALLHAVMKKRVSAVEWLVKRGADVRKQNKKGISPLKLAQDELRRNHEDKNATAMVKWLETPIRVVFHTKA
ncbi:ankyrin [Fusarium tjaetaba]|uniref:Ankyrin n=1 Tax=Fusarium tjaetaba TaxID=1567544 RepID=A0A8H5RR99_9HYPO|nr:ankyrin [Fusarium tjaetaba]KAF5640090.1 ankyrin [Fusarium tjaetaba]